MFKRYVLILFVLTLIFCGCRNEQEEQSADTKVSITEPDTLKNFYFVGYVNFNPGIQKYNLIRKEITKVWGSRRHKVVDFIYSPEFETAYFITAFRYGKEGVFPFVKETRVYSLNTVTEEVKLLDELGNGIQIFTTREDKNLRVVFNSFEETDATILYQKVKIYNPVGKIVLEERKTYDLTTEGYPTPINPVENKLSNTQKFQIILAENDTTNSVVLQNLIEGGTIKLTESKFKTQNIEWAYDDSAVVFNRVFLSPANETIYSNKPETSKLFIYSIPDYKLIKKWEGSGIKNFFIQNKTLVFDTGFGSNSSIIIYDINKRKVINTIKQNKGCGIKNIPEKPDFSA